MTVSESSSTYKYVEQKSRFEKKSYKKLLFKGLIASP